ncbi:MAG: TetR/AcrR family transcriptional regulator, partial [Deltaproteobacteria bacterium]|nr:TetR/AcrR family transcriptional regulator [Deltaproteobacteria bacterium]
MAQPAAKKPAQKETRAKILRAARSVFSEHPYHTASIRMIGKAAGLDHPLVSYHFRNKAELFEAVLADICEDYFAATTRWFKGLHGLGPEQGLALFIDRLLIFTRVHPEAFRILLLNMVQAHDSGIIPGYRFIQELFDRTTQTLKETVPMRASDDEIEMFRRNFNALLINYLGASTYYAGMLGMA